jgi:DNA primase
MTHPKDVGELAKRELVRVGAKRIDAYVLKSLILAEDFYEREGQKVRSTGSNIWKEAGTCPFHNDRKAGSFRINSLNGAFKCFSCGAKGGDIIEYTKKKYEIPFIEAIQKLSCDWGVR